MFLINTFSEYSVFLIFAIKKNFSAIARVIDKSADTIRRLLIPQEEMLAETRKTVQEEFKNEKELGIIIDDTLVKKEFSEKIEGVAPEYDTASRQVVKALRLATCAVTNGIKTFILNFVPIFNSKIFTTLAERRLSWLKELIEYAQKTFPEKRLIFIMDAAFATKEILKWLKENGIACEMRMHSNRKVVYQKKEINIKNIPELFVDELGISKTIAVKWDETDAFITSFLRINKRGIKKIIYQVSTYSATAEEHCKRYRLRWSIEKFFRTAKQSLGLQDCLSCSLETQLSHIASVVFIYNEIMIVVHKKKFKSAEASIEYLKTKKSKILKGLK